MTHISFFFCVCVCGLLILLSTACGSMFVPMTNICPLGMGALLGRCGFFWRVDFLPVGCVRSRQSGPWGVLIGTGQPNQFLWPECSNRALQEEALLGKGSETREEVLWDLWGCEACFTCPSRWENINSIKLQKIIVLAFLQRSHEEKPHSNLNPSCCSPNLVFYASVWLLECLI